MLARSGSLLAIAGVCALGVGLAPTASDAQGAQRAGPASAWSAPHARAVFPTEPVARTLHGTVHRLGTLGGDSSAAVDVEGQIVVGRADTADGDSHAFAYDLAAANPTMLDLGTLGGLTSRALAISGHVVVGSADTASGAHAFAYDLAAPRPHMVDLSPPDDTFAVATAVDDGIVVGLSSSTAGGAFAYDLNATSPRMVDLGSFGGASQATDVDAHVVAGWSTDSNFDRVNPFAYDLDAPTPTMRNLSRLKGGTEAFAKAIDGNLVVGDGGTRLSDGFHSHAFVADLGAPGAPLRDLGDLSGHGTGDSSASAVSGNVVVGGATRGRSLEEAQWAFAEDVSVPDAVMRSLGSLGGHSEDQAMDVEGSMVVGGASIVGTLNGHAFAYDLGAATPRMSDLGSAVLDEQEDPIRVSGNVVAGTQMVGGFDRARAWTLATTTAPALRFTKTKTFVRENAGHATVTVVRDGDTSAAVTVKYATRGIGGATPGRDFTPTRGTLSFGAGQTKAIFRVPIVNDKRREGRERFLVRLRDPGPGAIQGTPRVAAVVILSSDR